VPLSVLTVGSEDDSHKLACEIHVRVLLRSYKENSELCRQTACHTHSVDLLDCTTRSVDGRRGARWRVSDFTADLSWGGGGVAAFSVKKERNCEVATLTD
jgi:hypothetical protein